MAPSSIAKENEKASSALITLPKGTRLIRAFAQPPGAAPRAVAFNPKSVGRASPVLNSKGRPDPAMYFSVDSPQGAIAELLFHTVIKKHLKGGVVPESIFANVLIAELFINKPTRMVSIERLQQARLSEPHFSAADADYARTNLTAQQQYNLHQKVAGLTWHSARVSAVVGVWYASRLSKGAFSLKGIPVALLGSSLFDFVDGMLAEYGIVIDHGSI